MKKTLGPVNALYPSLTTIVGAMVDGKPNFLTIAHVGILNHGTPQYISVGLGKVHYTNRGIHENRAFSVNIPGQDLVAEADYVGLVSGKKTDKSGFFDLHYGQTANAPLISACPVAMECVLHDVYDLPTHDVFIGEIKEVHADEAVLTGDAIDMAKLRPLLFEMGTMHYWAIGEPVAKCWNVGKTVKQRLKEQA
jgi:flavin reductase (DIM6/NTAB) family NADH-FMN oxidoreductase RutF